ncbi:MAG: helix-turn-helix domain-containing protein [Balneola sp.]
MPKKIGSLTLYSVDDLHEMLGISKLTLRAYLREGKIRARKLGVSWYVTEDAIREYFEAPQPETNQKRKESELRYIVQGINDLVSETEECETKEEVLEILHEQAIISLFQVQVVDRSTNEITEIIKARDFIDRYANSK